MGRREDRNQERLEREVEEEGGTWRALRPRRQAAGSEGVSLSVFPAHTHDGDGLEEGQSLPSFSSSRLSISQGASSLGSTQQHRGRERGNVCRDKHDGVRGEVQGSGQMAGSRGSIVVPEALWQGGTDSRAALPREAGQRSPGGECLESQGWRGQRRLDQGLWRAQSLAAAGHGGVVVAGQWADQRGCMAGPASCGVESVAGGMGRGESAIRGRGRHWGRWAPMISQIVPE